MTARSAVAARAVAVAVLSLCAAQGIAHAAAPTRYAVLIGNNRGAGDEADLSYAESDAEKMHDVLRDLGGFTDGDLVLLQGKSAAAVRNAVTALNQRIRAAEGESVLLVYYSGHADAKALHLGDTELPISEMEKLLAGSTATVRLLVLDSCRSGSITRVKGGRAVQPFAIALDEPVRGRGAIFLTSSSMNEDAQESEQLQGSFFTHYLVSGLMGAADQNGDGRVGLLEAYRHAYTHTVRASSRTQRGIQHPTFRYDLRGRDDLVLTAPGATNPMRGSLIFPDKKTYLVLRDGREGAVVGEVGMNDKSRQLNLPAGRYFVIARGTRNLLEGAVDIAPGQVLAISDEQLARHDYARLARKGDGVTIEGESSESPPTSFSHGIEVGYRFRTSLFEQTESCHGAFVGYTADLRHLNVGIRLHGCRALTPPGSFMTVDELGTELRVSRSWDVWRMTLGVGVAAGFTVIRELPAEEYDSTWFPAGHIGPMVNVGMNIGDGWHASVDLVAANYLISDKTTFELTLGSRFALALGLALEKQW